MKTLKNLSGTITHTNPGRLHAAFAAHRPGAIHQIIQHGILGVVIIGGNEQIFIPTEELFKLAEKAAPEIAQPQRPPSIPDAPDETKTTGK